MTAQDNAIIQRAAADPERGVTRNIWLVWQVTEQAEAWYKTIKIKPEDAPLSQKAFWTPRDDYGWKSL